MFHNFRSWNFEAWRKLREITFFHCREGRMQKLSGTQTHARRERRENDREEERMTQKYTE